MLRLLDAELRNLQVFTVLVADGELAGQLPGWERAADALGIRPPAGRAGSGGASPDGAKFETFLYVDRVLGLDLPSDIGKAS